MSRSDPVGIDAAPEIDIVDDVFVTAPPRVLSRLFADPALCRRQWPDLVLRVLVDRGTEGVQWSVAGALRGSMEVWLEPVLDGTVVHYFLRAELPTWPDQRRETRLAAVCRARRVAVENRHRRLAARRLSFALKRRFERDRAPGCPPGSASGHDAGAVVSGSGPGGSPGGTE